MYSNINPSQNQPYLPTLLVRSGLFVHDRFSTAIVGIPYQSSNPNRYSPLLFYLILLVCHEFQKENSYNLLPVPPFHLANNYSRCLAYNKLAELFEIGVPCVALSYKVSEENSPSLVIVVNVPSQ